MTGIHALAVLMIRLWAIGAIFGGVSEMVGMAWYSPDEGGADRYFYYSLTDGAIWTFLGLVAWFSARAFAARAIPATRTDELRVSISADDLASLGSFIIGGFYVVEYLPKSAAAIAGAFIAAAGTSTYGSVEIEGIIGREFYSDLVLLGVALVLTFRPQDIANMFSAARVAGLSSVEQDPAQAKQSTPSENL